MRTHDAAPRRGFTDAELIAVYPRLFGFALTLTRGSHDQAADLTHDTIAQMLHYSRHFAAGTSLWAWGCTILKNLRNKHWRMQARGKCSAAQRAAKGGGAATIEHEMAALFPHEFWGCRDVAVCDQQLRLELKEVAGEIARMNGRGVATVLLALGEPQQLIAKELGVAVGTVKSRINRCRGELDRHFGIVRQQRRTGERTSAYR